MSGYNYYHELQYRVIRRHCRERMRIKVEEVYNEESQANIYENKIKINLNLTSEHRLYVILHEAGHFILSRSKSYGRLYEEGFETYGNHDYRGGYRTLRVSEEGMAWDKGLLLADRLKIRINRERYERYRTKMLRGYMRWALSR